MTAQCVIFVYEDFPPLLPCELGLVRMRNLSFVAVTLAFCAGVFVGLAANKGFSTKPREEPRQMRESGFGYTSPLLDCKTVGDYFPDAELKPFRDKLETFLKNDESRKWGDEISLYFRDLKNGPSFVIGRSEKFFPASLLKVPEMISVLKKAETDPSLLKRKIAYSDPELPLVQNTDVADKLVLGRSYTVGDLVRRMIVYSDNVSSILLEDMMNPADYRKTYDDLGIPDPYYLKDQGDYMISVDLYSSFFSILYNASYLNKEMSEKALAYLSETDYKRGLVAGVPPGVVVSHKFGLRKKNGIKQLHDCGIIYYPNHPYLLCVMTAGRVPEYLDNTIADVSRFVYEEIDRQYHRQR
jgi:beta-lactamase class A